MPLAHRTPEPTSRAAGPPAPAGAMHELADALAGARGHLGREVLAAAVQRLEALAGAPLGDVDHDAAVLLQRRAARALGLLPRAGAAVEEGVLRRLADDLRDPCAALLRAASLPAAPAATRGV